MDVHKVTFPDGTKGYDVNELDYCCAQLKSDVIADGGAVILIENGLCLRTNIPGPARRMNYCYNCSVQINHTDDTPLIEKGVEEIKEPVRDKV